MKGKTAVPKRNPCEARGCPRALMRGLGMKSGDPDHCTRFTRPILHRIFHPAFHVHSQEELMQAEMLIKFPPVASMGTYCWARCSSGH